MHFDVSLGANAKAIAAGAVPTDKSGPTEFTSRHRLQSANPATRKRAQLILERVAACRAMTSAIPSLTPEIARLGGDGV